jgi:hypothetical protein
MPTKADFEPVPGTARGPITAAPQQSAAAAAPTQRPSLWPKPIPVIGVTGPIGSGKTTFGLLIDPTRTLIYDEENSSKSYEDFGAVRVDVHKELHAKFPAGYKPIQAFEWWLADVRSRPAGKFSVIMLDTVGLIENGLVDYVEANPGAFGHTPAQHKNQNGAMKWGDVSKFWKQTLLDLSARCEAFVFTTHMTDVRANGEATGKLKPKGNKVLMEIASLYLELERKRNSKGETPEQPSAKVIKSRLVTAPVADAATGELKVHRILPPYLPVATPHAIRQYFAKPAGDQLRPDEQLPEEKLSDDDKLQLQAKIAEANARVAESESEKDRRRSAGYAANAAPATMQTEPAAPYVAPAGKATTDQLNKLVGLRGQLFATVAGDESAKRGLWSGILAKRKVTTARDLSTEQAEALIVALIERLNQGNPLYEHFQHKTDNANGSHAAAAAAPATAPGTT